MKYTFVTNAVVSLSREVEADSLEEAIDRAVEAGQSGKLVALWCGDASKGESTKEFKAARKVFS